MIQPSAIGWTKYTWNPWNCCNYVSPGCFFCYAEREIKGRFHQVFNRVSRSKSKFNLPRTLQKQVSPDGPLAERLVFTCSRSDFFHHTADPWREEAWTLMRQNDLLIYQVLTKRIERAAERLPSDWGEGYRQVWLGTSVESPGELHRIITLSSIPAQTRFISFEPLIERIPVSLLQTKAMQQALQGIHWVIIGGESGFDPPSAFGYRPCQLSWIEELAAFFTGLGIAVFVKQMGTALAREMNLSRDGKKPHEFPPHLQLQQFPMPPA